MAFPTAISDSNIFSAGVSDYDPRGDAGPCRGNGLGPRLPRNGFGLYSEERHSRDTAPTPESSAGCFARTAEYWRNPPRSAHGVGVLVWVTHFAIF